MDDMFKVIDLKIDMMGTGVSGKFVFNGRHGVFNYMLVGYPEDIGVVYINWREKNDNKKGRDKYKEMVRPLIEKWVNKYVYVETSFLFKGKNIKYGVDLE